MACKNSIKAWRPTKGGPLSFSGPKQDGRAYEPIEIPCGYCILCREEQARQQAVRITHEASLHEDNAFITLTYDPRHEPPYGGLRYADLDKFWKRLRKLYNKRGIKLRYYAVGEYGDKKQRAHYHACVFGVSFTENRIILRETPNLLWTTIELERCWGLGMVSVGSLNFQTARYTASYVTKKLRSKQKYVRVDEETGELIALEQPMARMSRNLAKGWWEKYYHQVVARDVIVIDGRPQKPPRAYDRWLRKKSELAAEMQREVRIKRQRKEEKKTPTQLRARTENAHARKREEKKTF